MTWSYIISQGTCRFLWVLNGSATQGHSIFVSPSFPTAHILTVRPNLEWEKQLGRPLNIPDSGSQRVNFGVHSHRYSKLDGAANGSPSLQENGMGNLSLAGSWDRPDSPITPRPLHQVKYFLLTLPNRSEIHTTRIPITLRASTKLKKKTAMASSRFLQWVTEADEQWVSCAIYLWLLQLHF